MITMAPDPNSRVPPEIVIAKFFTSSFIRMEYMPRNTFSRILDGQMQKRSRVLAVTNSDKQFDYFSGFSPGLLNKIFGDLTSRVRQEFEHDRSVPEAMVILI